MSKYLLLLFFLVVVGVILRPGAARGQISVRVGVIQMRIADSDREDNLRRAEEWIRRAATRQKVQIAVLPESFDVGWINPRARELAEPLPGPTSDRLASLARELEIHIVGTLTEKDGDNIYDSAFLVGPAGSLLAKHRKVNILRWDKPRYSGNLYYSPGPAESRRIADTAFGKIGLHICADIFLTSPDLTQKLRGLGARIVISPGGWVANPGTTVESCGAAWKERISRKARENGVYFIGANSVSTSVAGPDWHGLPYVGQSVIAAPDGRLLAVGSSDTEEVLVAELPL
jgi:predicted amidohydrolase